MNVIEKDLVVIDLFAGAGGLSLGAARAGFNVACAIDIDERALGTHSLNFPNTLHLKLDLMTVNGKQLLEKAGLKKGQVYGIIGGPPCQGFSTIGHRKVDDSRNDLYVRFFSIVNAIKPHFFIAENVLGILNERYNKIRELAFSKVKGYTILPHIVIKANECGASTTRTRVFFIGIHKSMFSVSSNYIEKYIQEQGVCVRDSLVGLNGDVSLEINKNGLGQINQDYILDKKISSINYHNRVRSQIPQGVGNPEIIANYYEKYFVTGCLPTVHSETVIERYRNLCYGQQDSISKSIRLNPNSYCPTLRAGTGPERGSFQAVRPIHYAYPRVITPREAARLQGFPDWFAFHPTIWHSFRQIGNSVSPIVAEKILSAIYHKLT